MLASWPPPPPFPPLPAKRSLSYPPGRQVAAHYDLMEEFGVVLSREERDAVAGVETEVRTRGAARDSERALPPPCPPTLQCRARGSYLFLPAPGATPAAERAGDLVAWEGARAARD